MLCQQIELFTVQRIWYRKFRFVILTFNCFKIIYKYIVLISYSNKQLFKVMSIMVYVLIDRFCVSQLPLIAITVDLFLHCNPRLYVEILCIVGDSDLAGIYVYSTPSRG